MAAVRSVITFFWLGVVLTVMLPFRAYVNKVAQTDFERAQKKMWRFAHWVGKAGCKLLGVPVTIKGTENIPETGSVVYVGNHQSMFDAPLMLAAISRPSGFIAKQELAGVPIFRGWVEAIGAFFLPRGESRRSLEIIVAAAKLLKQYEHGMVIFPEGTRSDDGSMRPFKPGSLKIAMRSGAAIVPFAIEGSVDVMPRGTFVMKPVPVTVTFLPAILPDMYKGKDTVALTGQIVQDIAQIVGCPVPVEDVAQKEDKES